MPELPEVESLRLGLLPKVLNQKIKRVEVRLLKIVSGKGTKRDGTLEKAKEFEFGITNQSIIDIQRRAKNLIFILDGGGRILIHLKMTGQLVFKSKNKNEIQTISGGHPIELSVKELPNKHTYVIFEMDDGSLFYNDVRQFGYVLYYPNQKCFDSECHFQDLGSEPLDQDFTLDNFTKSLKSKKGILKKVLLDQKVVVGLGNIYADEVCFEAGILPGRQISTLSNKDVEKLFIAIKRTIPRAVELGGSSVANYLLADGKRGNYAREHKVYKKAGKPCQVCGTILSKAEIAGRTTVFCTKCQR
jgi:formamidopyrimidine-DNA glycosylase